MATNNDTQLRRKGSDIDPSLMNSNRLNRFGQDTNPDDRMSYMQGTSISRKNELGPGLIDIKDDSIKNKDLD